MEITKYEDCCGCGLCENVCPVQAITFTKDKAGFFYPIVNDEKCINCGACIRNCVINHPPVIATHNIEAYSYSIDSTKLNKSASGGAAYAFGEHVIEENGVVYGVAYTKDYKEARYVRAENKKELELTRDTKYFHARNEKELFVHVEDDLSNEKSVLYIGLPCEIAALRNKFKDRYPNLILIEIFCHGVTTSSAQEKMISKYERKAKDKVIFFSLKDKKNGWSTDTDIFAKFQSGKEFREKFYLSPFGYSFMHLARLSCYRCKYKDNNRVADISIGDFWGIRKDDLGYNNNGVSAIVVNTEKGKQFVDSFAKNHKLNQADADYILDNNPWTRKSIPLGDRMEYEKKFVKHQQIYVPLLVRLKNWYKNNFS